MNDDVVDFRELFRIIGARWWLVALAVAAGIAMGGLQAYTTVPKYRAVSKMVCQMNTSGGNEMAGLAALAGINLDKNGPSDPSLYFEDIIQDDEFLEKILVKKWAIKGDSLLLEEIWGLRPDTTRPDWAYLYKQARIERLREGDYIRYMRNKSNNTLILTTLFESPELTRQINNHVINLLNDYLRTNLRSQAKEKRIFIDEQNEEIRKNLEQSEMNLVRFRQRNLNVQAPDLLLEQARLQREATLNQELYIQMKKQQELAKIDEKKDEPLIEVISKPVVPTGKFQPKVRMLLIIGGGAGFILGLALVFLHYWFAPALSAKRRKPGAPAGREAEPAPMR